MTAELRITWKGGVPGIAEGGLSLTHFADSLRLLVKSVQITASQILAGELDNPDYGQHGSLRKEARGIDVIVSALEHNCLTLVASGTCDENPALVDQALTTFVRSLEAEAAGKTRSYSVRSYLASLPDDLSSQRYRVSTAGRVLAEVEVGEYHVPKSPRPPHRVRKFLAEVCAIDLEKETLTLRHDGSKTKFRSNARQVAEAWSLREQAVQACALFAPDGARLMWLKSEASPVAPQTAKERLPFHMARWDSLLERLAQ